MEATLPVRFADLGWPIISPLISRVTAHWANHCDLIVDERMISVLPGGVREWNIEDLPARRAMTLLIPCTRQQRAEAIAFARRQIGKPYDYGAVISFAWGAPWNDERRWFCSELTAAALDAAGIIRVPRVRRVSPGSLARLFAAHAAA